MASRRADFSTSSSAASNISSSRKPHAGKDFFYHSVLFGAIDKRSKNLHFYLRILAVLAIVFRHMSPETNSRRSAVDVVGVGINATDTIIRLPKFPALDSKVEIRSVERKAGGQVASAMVACARWGLRARYIGKIADDDAGEFQQREMARENVEAHWLIAPGCSSQSSFILVDEASGERTVLWKRDPAIAIQPEDLSKDFILGARALLVDGHDTAAAALAAKWASEEGLPVVGDFDNLYPGIEAVLQNTSIPIVSKEFPQRLTGHTHLLESIPEIHAKFKCHITVATLGRLGVLAWDGSNFLLCPGFKVTAMDTTGAGDIFHGAFLYGLLHRWALQQILEFSCAAAAVNCTATGARGNIASREEIDGLCRSAERSEHAFSDRELLEAAIKARKIAGAKAPCPPPDCRRGNPI